MESDKRVQLFNPTWKQIYLKFESEKIKQDTYHECIGFDFSFNPQTAHCMSASSTLFEMHKAAAMYYWYKEAKCNDYSILNYFDEYKHCIDEKHKLFNSNYGMYAYKQKGLSTCIERLKKNPMTRQAMFCINNKEAMSDKSIDKLCTNAVHFFIRNGKLQMIVQMRSSNFVTLLPYDAFMFSVFFMEVFNELVKQYTWLEVGEIKMQIASLHYYSHNWSSIGNSQLIEKPIMIDFADHNCSIDLESKLVNALAQYEKMGTNKRIIILNPRRKNKQKRFDEALNELNEIIGKGGECDIALETLTGKNITIVEGYIDTVYDDVDKKLVAMPCRWFNKQVLDDLKIKYEKK